MSESEPYPGIMSGMETATIEYLKEGCYELFCDALRNYRRGMTDTRRDPNYFVNPVEQSQQWRGATLLTAKFILMTNGQPDAAQWEIDALARQMSVECQERHKKQFPGFFKRTNSTD